MQEVTHYPPGTFSWIDLSTTDAAGAKKFYTDLFGWTAHDVPAGPDMIYTMLHLEGKEVAALSQMGAEQQAQGVPPHWLSYLTVDKVDEMAQQVTALGGTVLMPPFDIFDAGRMTMAQDPTGTTFALWQPKEHIGAKLVNVPSTLAWNELATTDEAKAGEFYSQLFGWERQTQEMPTGPYTTFHNQGRMVGGMMQMTEEWGDIPPHWMVYFSVADCDASLEKAQALGGQR